MRIILITLLAMNLVSPCLAETKQHDFKGAATPEIYKVASGDSLWIYRFDPPGETKETTARPAVVFFFGGGWNSGSVTQFAPHAEYLASRGMVAFVADYRVKSRQQTDPDSAVADAKSAVRWLRKNASRLGIDPDRIAAGGGSAGGHIAAAAGMCDGLDDPADDTPEISSKPNALLLFNPVYDNGPSGYGHSRVKKWFPAISPSHNLSEDDPPTIVFLGTKDDLIPVATAEKIHQKMQSLGIQSELHLYPNQSHGFFNQNRNAEAFADTLVKTDAFLVSLQWLKGEPDQAMIERLGTASP